MFEESMQKTTSPPRWKVFRLIAQCGYANQTPGWLPFRVTVRPNRKRLKNIDVFYNPVERRFARSSEFAVLEAHPDAPSIKAAIEHVVVDADMEVA